MQILLQVDEKGVYTGESSAFAIAGFMRTKGDSDAALNRLFHEKKLLSFAQ
jgi:small subunit ribosomal protein S21e